MIEKSISRSFIYCICLIPRCFSLFLTFLLKKKELRFCIKIEYILARFAPKISVNLLFPITAISLGSSSILLAISRKGFFNGFNANPNFGKGILLCIELELLAKSSGINLNISDESLTFYVGKLYSLEINLPFKINSNNSKSIFNIENRILFVYLPFYEKDINEFIKLKKAAEEKEKNINEMKDKINISEDYLYDVVA